MKKPELPPNNSLDWTKDAPVWHQIMEDTHLRNKLNELEREHLYWDKFKYKAKDWGIDPAALWRFAKMQRTQGTEKLRISNIPGFEFKYKTTSATLKLLHGFDLNMGGLLEASAVIPNEDKQRYLVSSIMEEAIASSQLEGAVATREEAKDMLRQNRPPKTVSERMILNNYLTMQKILELKDRAFTPELIKEIHAIITKDALEKEAQEGTFRDNNNVNVVDVITGEVFYSPPKYENLEILMADFCAFANDKNDKIFIHPIVRGIILHFLIGYIHPFADGNGRTARALFYWYLISKGYWLVEYLSISRIILQSKSQYAKAYLYTEYDENDLTYFIDYNLKSMDLAFKSLKEYISKKIKEKSLLFDVLKYEDINARQVEILRDVIHSAETIVTIAQVQHDFGIVYQTARTDLLKLVEMGYLELKTSGKKMLFFKSNDFDSKIKKIKF